MKVVSTNQTIADYCEAMQRNEITVNQDYQRSDDVWPPVARSFLVETILLGYPTQKFFLAQHTDLKSKKTRKEIVDGQQRSRAIREFYEDRFRISKTSEVEEVRGKSFSELPDEFKDSFLRYPISVDIFVAAAEDEIRDTFRRMNSYTVPLNPEEKRHAAYQGKFKWFIRRMTKQYANLFETIGLLSNKQLVRMQDAKLLTDIVYAIDNGISTTKSPQLNSIYKKFDSKFDAETKYEKWIDSALSWISGIAAIHNSSIMRQHVAFTLILAFIHIRYRVRTFERDFKGANARLSHPKVIARNLTTLSEALESPKDYRHFKKFIEASATKTNTREQRAERFSWFCKALTTELAQ